MAVKPLHRHLFLCNASIRNLSGAVLEGKPDREGAPGRVPEEEMKAAAFRGRRFSMGASLRTISLSSRPFSGKRGPRAPRPWL
jgi:hypothetical protein